MEVHDLVCSKLVAGRERDTDFLRVLLRERMVDPQVLDQRLGALPIPSERIQDLRTVARRQATAL